MTRMEILKAAFKEGGDKFKAIPEDEKPVAAMVLIASAVVFIIAVIGIIALALTVAASFWYVPVVAAIVWYFWPRISNLLKKRG